MKCNSISQKSNLLLSPSIFLSPQNVHRTVHTRIDVCIVLHTLYTNRHAVHARKVRKDTAARWDRDPILPIHSRCGRKKEVRMHDESRHRGGSR